MSVPVIGTVLLAVPRLTGTWSKPPTVLPTELLINGFNLGAWDWYHIPSNKMEIVTSWFEKFPLKPWELFFGDRTGEVKRLGVLC